MGGRRPVRLPSVDGPGSQRLTMGARATQSSLFRRGEGWGRGLPRQVNIAGHNGLVSLVVPTAEGYGTSLAVLPSPTLPTRLRFDLMERLPLPRSHLSQREMAIWPWFILYQITFRREEGAAAEGETEKCGHEAGRSGAAVPSATHQRVPEEGLEPSRPLRTLDFETNSFCRYKPVISRTVAIIRTVFSVANSRNHFQGKAVRFLTPSERIPVLLLSHEWITRSDVGTSSGVLTGSQDCVPIGTSCRRHRGVPDNYQFHPGKAREL